MAEATPRTLRAQSRKNSVLGSSSESGSDGGGGSGWDELSGWGWRPEGRSLGVWGGTNGLFTACVAIFGIDRFQGKHVGVLVFKLHCEAQLPSRWWGLSLVACMQIIAF